MKIPKIIPAYVRPSPDEGVRQAFRRWSEHDNDPWEKLESIEDHTKACLEVETVPEMLDTFNGLLSNIKDARKYLEAGDTIRAANEMYVIGETVGRLDHVRRWGWKDIAISFGVKMVSRHAQAIDAGGGSHITDVVVEEIRQRGRVIKEKNKEIHHSAITGMIYDERKKKPSKPIIREILREAKIIPPKKGK